MPTYGQGPGGAERKGKMRKRIVKGIVCLIMAFALMIPASMMTGVRAEAAEQELTLRKKNVTMFVGEKLQLESYGTTKTVTWKTSSKKIATVSKTGVVTAVKAGTTRITASAGGQSYFCVVKVIDPYFEYEDYSIELGVWEDITFTGSFIKSVKSSDTKIVYTENLALTPGEREVADVAYGLFRVRSVSKGTATVTVKAENGKSYKFKVKVTEPYVLTKKVTYNPGHPDDKETVTYKYDKYGNVAYEETSWGDYRTVKEYEYYANGSRKMESEKGYNTDGLPQMYSGFRYEYDEKGVMVCKTIYHETGVLNGATKKDKQPRSTKTTYKYDEKDNLLSEISEHYDMNGKLTETDETVNTYDKNGNLLSGYKIEMGYKLKSWTCKYDKNNRLISERTDEIGRDGDIYNYYETRYEYDKEGREIKKTSYEKKELLETVLTYYAADRVFTCTCSKDGDVGGDTIETDEKGRVIRAESWHDIYEFKYDDAGNCIYELYTNTFTEMQEERFFDGDEPVTKEDCKYNEYGKLSSRVVTDRDGMIIQSEEYSYDRYGNPSYVKTYSYKVKPDGTTEKTTREEENEYDEDGNCMGYEYSSSILTKYPGWESEDETLLYGKTTFDDEGRMIDHIVYNSDYGYDEMHYDENGLLIKKVEVNGQVTDFTYDEDGNLLSEVTTGLYWDKANGKQSYEYTYDANGNRLSRTYTRGTIKTVFTYTYDSQNRLTSEDNGGPKYTYTYDKASGKVAVEAYDSEWESSRTENTYKLLSKAQK